MIQRQVSHPIGTFAACNGCRREPRHFLLAGRTNREAATSIAGTHDRHVIECCRCNRTTARHASLDDAVAEWGAAHAQASLPLRIVTARRRVAG